MPPSRKYSDPDAIAKVADLTLRSRRLVEGAINGQHRSPFHGFNVEFAQYRDYTPGDDLRRLDWRVFARSDRHYIKQYEEESNVKVTFVVDASASMNYKGSAPLSKFDYAATMVVALSMLLTRQQDPVGLVLFDEAASTVLPPDAKPSQVDVISGLLQRCEPTRKTDLGGLLKSITNQGKRRGLMVIVSDLLTDLDTVYDGLNRLRFLGHEVLVMQVLDRDEMELPFDGPTIFADIEGDEEVFAEPWAFRRSYRAAMVDFLDGVKKECGSRGYDHVRFLTDEPLGESLSLFLHGREEVGRGRAPLMMTFLSPLLAWGALLGVIPIIIHLLNRRKFRRVEWAPMRYLKLTVQRNRRRVQVEQLLLMLLRVAALALLFFFLARPVVNPTGLEGWLGSGGRSSQVVLIDDSLSMGYGSSEAPAFRQAKEAAGSLVASARAEDRFTILAASNPKAPVVHEVEGSRREDLAGAVASIPPTAVHAAWPAVLDGVEEVLRSCTYPTRQLTILTDLRKSGWDGGVSPIARKWAEDGLRVRIFDVGADDSANVALLGIVPLDRTILAGAESQWEAVIRNDSPRLLDGLKAILRVDDRPTEVKLPEIAPRATARVPLTVRFPGPGLHDLSLQLPDDALPGDNQRWAAVPVKDSLLVRLVDGDPSSEPFGSEVDYLAAPLSIGIGAAEAWRVEVALDNDFLNPRLDQPDVLVLANVAAPTPEQADRLLKLVKGGMGLMIYTGSKVDAGVYNDLLFRGTNKLLPARFKGVVDSAIQGVIVEPVRPSPIEKLLELKTSALERVAVRQIMAVGEPGEEDGKVRVLARWNDPTRSPAVVERIVGEGRVLLWTTTADRAGNDWPIEPSFVLAVREAVRGTARPTKLTNTVTAGDSMRLVVRSNQQLANARVTPPGGGEPRALTPTPLAEPLDERGPAVSIDVPDTRRAGLYRITWDEGPLGTQQDAYAANPDPRESDLGRISESDLKGLLKPLAVEVASAKGTGAELFAPTGREVWHELAWGLLAVLIFESILATWVGRSR